VYSLKSIITTPGPVVVTASGLLQAKVSGRVYLDHPPPLFSTGACITLALLALLGVVCA